jgi:CRP-like cAMP-binding protein
MFRSLSQDQINTLVSAMVRQEHPEGSTIVNEGDDGSEMFLIESGECAVYYGQEQVGILRPGQAFGEIALMYNCPRSVTIKASKGCAIWVLDSKPFKRILMATSIQKREKYEHFLEQVSLLKHLSSFERAKIADALEPVEYPDKAKIVTQGEKNASTFYIVEQGTVHVYKRDPADPNSREYFVREYKPGDYFCEIALLTSVPRQASCVAVGPVRCLALSREHFFQVMTGVENILRGNVYEDYGQLVARWTAATTAQRPANSNIVELKSETPPVAQSQ